MWQENKYPDFSLLLLLSKLLLAHPLGRAQRGARAKGTWVMQAGSSASSSSQQQGVEKQRTDEGMQAKNNQQTTSLIFRGE